MGRKCNIFLPALTFHRHIGLPLFSCINILISYLLRSHLWSSCFVTNRKNRSHMLTFPSIHNIIICTLFIITGIEKLTFITNMLWFLYAVSVTYTKTNSRKIRSLKFLVIKDSKTSMENCRIISDMVAIFLNIFKTTHGYIILGERMHKWNSLIDNSFSFERMYLLITP